MVERLKTNVIPPDGPESAQIAFVGEAPGADEDSEGKPFVGTAGRLLNRILSTLGVPRSSVLVLNIFDQRPPKNDIDYFYTSSKHDRLTWEGEEHLEKLQIYLQRLLKQREATGKGPNVLVALGAIPLRHLTGKKRLNKWRGSVLPCTLVPGFKVYPTYHPSYVNRMMNEKREALIGEAKKDSVNVLPIFYHDLKRVTGEVCLSPDLNYPKRNLVTEASFAELLSHLKNLNQARTVAVDIETLQGRTGPVIWCIGFSPSPDQAFVVPIIKNQRFAWSVEEEAALWREISTVFLDPLIRKVFHNGLFDLSILGALYGLRVEGNTFEDTMYGFQSIYPEQRKKLELLTSLYTYEPYYKDDGKVWMGKRVGDQAEFIYNAKDCAVTRECWNPIEEEIKREGHWSSYKNRMSCIPSLLKMQIRGVRFDLQARDELAISFKQKAEEALASLKTITEQDLNFSSSRQLAGLLYGYYGMPIQHHHKTGQVTTDKDAINRLKKRYSEETEEGKVLRLLSSYAEYSKLISTYSSMTPSFDGRIRTSYGWVSTFRLSSSEALAFGGGGNLQNIPSRTEEGRLVRKLFIPDDGMEMGSCDLAKAEAMEVAWLANDPILKKIYKEGWDVHWEKAKEIFGIPSDIIYDKANGRIIDAITGELQTHSFLRRVAKTVVHASNYGMGPRMLQNILIRENVYLPESTCRSLLENAKRRSPLIQAWQASIREEIRSTRTLVTPLGTKRTFRGRFGDELYRSAYAFIPQSTVGELLQQAIRDIDQAGGDWLHVLLNVHDEVVFQYPLNRREEAKKIVLQGMLRPHLVNGEILTIPCEFKFGKSWGEMKEEEK